MYGPMITRRALIAAMGAAALASPVHGRGAYTKFMTGHMGNIGSRLLAPLDVPPTSGIDRKRGPGWDLQRPNGAWASYFLNAGTFLHLAACVRQDDTPEADVEIYNDNIISLINLCEFIKPLRPRKFVFASSVGVDPELYGYPPKLLSPYSKSKIWAEEYLRSTPPCASVTAIRIGYAPHEPPTTPIPDYMAAIQVSTANLVNAFGDAMEDDRPGFTVVEMVGQKRTMRF